jgi:hypothetical protein
VLVAVTVVHRPFTHTVGGHPKQLVCGQSKFVVHWNPGAPPEPPRPALPDDPERPDTPPLVIPPAPGIPPALVMKAALPPTAPTAPVWASPSPPHAASANVHDPTDKTFQHAQYLRQRRPPIPAAPRFWRWTFQRVCSANTTQSIVFFSS